MPHPKIGSLEKQVTVASVQHWHCKRAAYPIADSPDELLVPGVDEQTNKIFMCSTHKHNALAAQ